MLDNDWTKQQNRAMVHTHRFLVKNGEPAICLHLYQKIDSHGIHSS